MKPVCLLLIPATFWLVSCSVQEKVPGVTGASGPVVSGNHIKLPADSPQLAHIQTVIAKAQSVPLVELILPARIEADPRRVSHIALPVTGRINKVLVTLGDTVRQGQPVLTVDSPDAATAMSAYRQAEANIAQAKASFAKADADLVRVTDLQSNGAAPQKDVLAAQAVKVQSQAAVTQGEASRDETLKRLQILGIKPGNVIGQVVTVASTVTGKVTEINAVGGEFRSDVNTPFLTVADLSIVWISADVPEDRIRLVRLGALASVKMAAYPGETFTAPIRRIGDVVDPQTRTIKVRAELKNATERFRPDMFAEIHLTQGSASLPLVPAARFWKARANEASSSNGRRAISKKSMWKSAGKGPINLASPREFSRVIEW